MLMKFSDLMPGDKIIITHSPIEKSFNKGYMNKILEIKSFEFLNYSYFYDYLITFSKDSIIHSVYFLDGEEQYIKIVELSKFE